MDVRAALARILSILAALFALSYPFLVYLSWDRVPPRLFLGASILLFALRFTLSASRQPPGAFKTLLAPWILPGIFLLIAFVLGRRSLYLYWPCVVSASLLVVFGGTLLRPPSLVERFARLQKPELSGAEAAYCRMVTGVWCCFFVVNGMIALVLTRGASLERWALYNGFIAYLVMGALFASEYIYRHWRFRPDNAWLSSWMDRWIR